MGCYGGGGRRQPAVPDAQHRGAAALPSSASRGRPGAVQVRRRGRRPPPGPGLPPAAERPEAPGDPFPRPGSFPAAAPAASPRHHLPPGSGARAAPPPGPSGAPPAGGRRRSSETFLRRPGRGSGGRAQRGSPPAALTSVPGRVRWSPGRERGSPSPIRKTSAARAARLSTGAAYPAPGPAAPPGPAPPPPTPRRL